MGLIPGSGRSFGGRHGNALQHSCLENPMDRGAWWDTIHEVAESRTRLSTHTQCFLKEEWTWRETEKDKYGVMSFIRGI